MDFVPPPPPLLGNRAGVPQPLHGIPAGSGSNHNLSGAAGYALYEPNSGVEMYPVGIEQHPNYYNFFYYYDPSHPSVYDDYYRPASASHGGVSNTHSQVRLPRAADKGPKPFTDQDKREHRDVSIFLHDVFDWCKMHNIPCARGIKFFLEGTVREDWERSVSRNVCVDDLEESATPSMSWKEVCHNFRILVGADMQDEFFTSATALMGTNAEVAMKSGEKVNEYILRFRRLLSKLDDEMGSKLQVFSFTQNLSSELKEECALQPGGQP